MASPNSLEGSPTWLTKRYARWMRSAQLWANWQVLYVAQRGCLSQWTAVPSFALQRVQQIFQFLHKPKRPVEMAQGLGRDPRTENGGWVTSCFLFGTVSLLEIFHQRETHSGCLNVFLLVSSQGMDLKPFTDTNSLLLLAEFVFTVSQLHAYKQIREMEWNPLFIQVWAFLPSEFRY